LFFAGEMGRLKREEIPVFIGHGNHDAESELTKSLTLPENVTVFSTRKAETKALEHLGVVLHGQSFRDAKTEENLAVAYPPAVPDCFNIGVLHTAVEGHAEHAPYAPCSLSDLTDKGYDYWALGHVHEYKILSEDPLVVFPGNLQGRHIRETGPRGALMVTVENGKPTVERLFVDTVRWHRIEIDAGPAQSLQDVVRLARDRLETLLRESADGRPLATRVIFTGHSRAHGELFGLETQLRQEILAAANALGDNELWIEKVILNTIPELDAAAIEARSDAIADLQSILAGAGSAPEIRQRIIDDLTELVGKVPLELIDAVPELGAIKAGNIDDQLEKVSLGLIAHMAGEGESR
jgi:predicted phosphodiesterase